VAKLKAISSIVLGRMRRTERDPSPLLIHGRFLKLGPPITEQECYSYLFRQPSNLERTHKKKAQTDRLKN
jgi:hypothetical protein